MRLIRDTRGVTMLAILPFSRAASCALVNSLNNHDTTYTLLQPSKVSTCSLRGPVCRRFSKHVAPALADNTVGSFPENVDDDEEFAVLVGCCVQVYPMSRTRARAHGADLVVVVQTRASDNTFSLVRSLIKIVPIVAQLPISRYSSIHLEVGIPLFVHIDMIVIWPANEKPSDNSRSFDQIHPLDVDGRHEDLMRTFNIMATFFYLNRKHVPEHVLHAQMQR